VGRNSKALAFGSVTLGLLSESRAYAATALGSGAIAEHEGSVSLGTASRTVRGAVASYAAFGVNDAQRSSGEIAIGRNISYFDPITNRDTPTGDRQLTGLAAGSADSDAVNLAQLKGISASLGKAIAGGLGGGARYDASAGSISGPTYLVNGATYTNVSDAFGALASQFSTGQLPPASPPTGQPAPAQPDQQLLAQLDALRNQLAVLQEQIANLQSAATQGAVGAAQLSRLSNVANGRVEAGSTDAVNGSQLAGVQRDIASSVRYDTTSDGGSTDRVTLAGGANGAGTTLVNVAAGAVTADSREAVNGSQLHGAEQAINSVRTTATEALALHQHTIRYDDASQTAVTFAAGKAPVRLRNLAAGVESTDAATVGQLNAGLGRIFAEANAYTDARVAALGFDLSRASRRAASGTSSALAIASLPQPYESGRSMVSLGLGTFDGEQAISLGFSGAGSDGRMVAKAGITRDTTGRTAASAGMGWQF
ncbi:YadA-like family protein, partial [Qipengyuania sp.]|uniref:YadA-like family protein n=1 Tax=Qipengyuania sp. TaxID=2004515 RepID=UPI0035C84941